MQDIILLMLLITNSLFLYWVYRKSNTKDEQQQQQTSISDLQERISNLQQEQQTLEEANERLFNECATSQRNYHDYEERCTAKQQELESITSQINAAIDVLKSINQTKEQKNFNRIQIPPSEVEEARQLLELSNSFPKIAKTLKEVVFKFYYQTHITQMIKRVTNGRRIAGIYKITEIETGKCYVGQSVDIGNRWLTHCKRVFGVENETSNLLYPALRRIGLENVTFEIIQECGASDLNRLEKYWQEVLQAKTFGYSVK